MREDGAWGHIIDADRNLAYLTDELRRTFGRMSYSILGELSTASEKARRDAPVIAVCEL